MRDDLPSVTAIYVAMARALATQDPELRKACTDPAALTLLPSLLRPFVQAASHPLAASALRHASFGLQDHLALRTALIDNALEAGVEQQPEGLQLVLLGAGLDARAHRMTALANVRVFEVDHPATQKLKQAKARDLPIRAQQLLYVPCDFHQTDLTTALRDAGFDRNAPSIWIWEGVTMYLPESAVHDSLTRIADLSAQGSLLIATYITPDIVVGGRSLGRWATRWLSMVAEPLRYTVAPEQLEQVLRSHHFTVLNDVAPVEAAPHYEIAVKRPSTLMPKERIVVARRL